MNYPFQFDAIYTDHSGYDDFHYKETIDIDLSEEEARQVRQLLQRHLNDYDEDERWRLHFDMRFFFENELPAIYQKMQQTLTPMLYYGATLDVRYRRLWDRLPLLTFEELYEEGKIWDDEESEDEKESVKEADLIREDIESGKFVPSVPVKEDYDDYALLREWHQWVDRQLSALPFEQRLQYYEDRYHFRLDALTNFSYFDIIVPESLQPTVVPDAESPSNPYDIQVEVCLGRSCSGMDHGDTGHVTLTLTDQEAQQIREQIAPDETDSDIMSQFEEKLPGIYEKLFDEVISYVYFVVANDARESGLWQDCIQSGRGIEDFIQEDIDSGAIDSEDEQGNPLPEDQLYDIWSQHEEEYIHSLPHDEAYQYIIERYECEPDNIDGVSYTIKLPKELEA